MQNSRTPLAFLMTAMLCLALALAGTAAAQNDTNRGTVKIHDGPDADPDQRNEPHVSCDFYVEGFNFNDDSGYLRFEVWPPTSNKAPITPTGDDLEWTGTSDGDGGYDFEKGAYYLPEGHYRLEVFTYDGHPSHDEGHFAKAKMFWVDPCEDEQPPCIDDNTTAGDDCDPAPCVDNPDTEIDECDETEIPFFPGFTSLALGSLGALAIVGMMWRRRA